MKPFFYSPKDTLTNEYWSPRKIWLDMNSIFQRIRTHDDAKVHDKLNDYAFCIWKESNIESTFRSMFLKS